MINISEVNSQDCCGCTACRSVCPKNAISMVTDFQGFVMPSVDKDLCIECNLCEKVCPVINKDKFEVMRSDAVFVGALKDIEERLQSQSGGAFWALATAVINQGGVVYGCGYKDHFVAAHKRSEDLLSCSEFRLSKYVQSDMGDSFVHVKNDLQNNKLVLFSGTPCQCAGLISFLGEDYSNLIICDIICHGVPSPKLVKDYISELESKNKSEVVDLIYRFKDGNKYEWGKEVEKITFSDGKNLIRPVLSNLFYSHAFMRESCYVCPFGSRATSDITIADAWGCEEFASSVDTKYGMSTIIIHSLEKKKIILSILSESMELQEAKLDDIKKYQPNLSAPIQRSKRKEKYVKMFLKHGVLYTWTMLNRRAKAKEFLRKIIK